MLLVSLLASTLLAASNPLDLIHQDLAAGRLESARAALRRLPEPTGAAQQFSYWNATGSIALLDGKLTAAARAFARTLPHFEAVAPAEQAAVHLNLAAVALRLGHLAEGERQASRAVMLLEQRPDDPRLARALASWSTALALLDRRAEARRAIDRALAVAAPGDRPALLSQRALLRERGRAWAGTALAPGIDLAELAAGGAPTPVRVR